MSYLFVTSSIDFTRNRAGALSFEEAADKLHAMVRAAFPRSMEAATGIRCLVMFNYGPSDNSSFQLKFSKKRNELSMDIPVTLVQFELVQVAHRPLFLELLLWVALNAIRSRVKGVEDAEVAPMKSCITTDFTVRSPEIGYLYELAESICSKTDPRTLKGTARTAGPIVPSLSYSVVIQLPASVFDSPEGATLETSLDSALGETGYVDGNDVDADKLNIFIATTHPLDAFENIRVVLKKSRLLKMATVACSKEQEDDYKVLWPPGGEFQL